MLPAGGKAGPVETPSGDSLRYSRNLGWGGVGKTGTSQSSWGQTDRYSLLNLLILLLPSSLSLPRLVWPGNHRF